METWHYILIVIGIIVFIYIISRIRKKRKTKQPEHKISKYLEKGDYISAGSLYIDQNKHSEAANLYFQIPPEKRPAYEAMIRKKLGKQGAQIFWTKTGRRLEKYSPTKARIAYSLGEAYFDSIKMYIENNDLENAIAGIDRIPERIREAFVRRLSQYAFNRGKTEIAAKMLHHIGFTEEADAILAVAAHEYDAIQRPERAADIYDEVGRQDLVGDSQEELGEKALSQGRIADAKDAFKKAIKAYDNSNRPKDAVRVEKRLENFELLEKFQNIAEKGDPEKAEALFDQIKEEFPEIAISDLYAEIAKILEKQNRSAEAVTYYDKAADSTRNPMKKQSYINSLRRVGSQIAHQRSVGEHIAQKNLKDKCIVCKRQIKAGQKYTFCPYCGKPAHYSHLIEWIKVQGSCPNCQHRLRVDDIKDT
ncbi:MAG: hypothetical protein U9O98_11540 [Asgard group archaeon]|nr:hypothetical protein [Asgard group archaeon]